MCGIVGVFPIKTASTQVSLGMQRAMTLWFHNEILAWTIERGKDATGLVATFGPPLDPESQADPTFFACLKQPVDAEDFFLNDGSDKRYAGQKKNANIEFLMEALSNVNRPLLHMIGHTRAKTTGSELNPMNNHPILIGNIIGVHNGGVRNSKEIFKKHKDFTPVGEVDSEAIFQLFAEVSNDKPIDWDALRYVWQRIEGPRAVMAFNNKHPHTVGFFRDYERPLELCVLPELGLMVLCSKREYVKNAVNAYQRMRLARNNMPGDELERLPRISVDWTTITSSEGGVIDLTKEFDGGSIDKFVDMQRLPTLLSDYRVETTTTYKGGYGPNGIGFQSQQGRSNGTSAITSSSAGQGAIVAGSNGTRATTESDMRTPVNGAAIVRDLSHYDDEGETAPLALVAESHKTNSESVVLSDSDVMDDVSEDISSGEIAETPAADDEVEMKVIDDEDAVEDDDDGDDDDSDSFYSEEQLREQAERLIFDPDYATNKMSVLVRMKGKMKELLGIDGAIGDLTEDQARHAVEFVYPELFSDGFVVGYRAGEADVTEHFEREDDTLEREKTSLEEENTALKEENELLNKQLKKSVTHMANLKGFLFAVLLANDQVKVDADDNLQFSGAINAFLEMSQNGFQKVKPSIVKKLFTKKDKQIIKSGLTSEARQLTDPPLTTPITELELG